MSEKKYAIELAIKHKEDKYLATEIDLNSAFVQLFLPSLDVKIYPFWANAGEKHRLELSEEHALLVIDKILAAALPKDPMEMSFWALLKLQACCSSFSEDEPHISMKLNEHLNTVYIGLYDVAEGCTPKQWELELRTSQKREY